MAAEPLVWEKWRMSPERRAWHSEYDGRVTFWDTTAAGALYFNCVEIEENVLFSFVPMPLTTEMIAMEMPAAIRPYSMAVAAVSSRTNALTAASIDNK